MVLARAHSRQSPCQPWIHNDEQAALHTVKSQENAAARPYFRRRKEDYSSQVASLPRIRGVRFTGRYWSADCTIGGKRSLKNYRVAQFGFEVARLMALQHREKMIQMRAVHRQKSTKNRSVYLQDDNEGKPESKVKTTYQKNKVEDNSNWCNNERYNEWTDFITSSPDLSSNCDSSQSELILSSCALTPRDDVSTPSRCSSTISSPISSQCLHHDKGSVPLRCDSMSANSPMKILPLSQLYAMPPKTINFPSQYYLPYSLQQSSGDTASAAAQTQPVAFYPVAWVPAYPPLTLV
ncbi:hypothetical protein IE077_000903 [Cardiosporidium cionae]|uniref:AP2/ERF domain-containing protein n=1 Tax=Cardiosporidium cionae TaxID=476202 RepID=A0ABQ7JDQ6_9APIC|nr:hypothetical protein IE077_000903 [Cardiosporidium cionae]|eukprot:KAF8822158.1 hypothetical protein IE077_000903 [Cardiosporidium cionae]